MTHIELHISANDLETLNLAAASALEWLPGAKITNYTANGMAPLPPTVDPDKLVEPLRTIFRSQPTVTIEVTRTDDRAEAALRQAMENAIAHFGRLERLGALTREEEPVLAEMRAALEQE